MRAWLVWGVATAAYVVAVLQRTSFGVSGIEASERFDAAPSMLSAFVVLQLVVYAVMQIPAGLALDRFGSRRLIATGAVVMAGGQFMLAFTESLPVAIAGRALVGVGDALTFGAALRLVPAWFPDRRVPLITQLTGMTGQLGQVLSAIPLLQLLQISGWTPAYASAASLGVLAAVLALLVIRDNPPDREVRTTPVRFRDVPAVLRNTWLHPGTRLGFFTHMGGLFPLTTFLLMWGVPYLTQAQGLSPEAAGGLLTLSVVTALGAGPIVGLLTGRYPMRRSWMAIAVVLVDVGLWTIVLALDSPAPVWLLGLLIMAMSVGGPISAVGLDYARTFNELRVLGTAQGMVNIGGFLASLLVIQTMGMILDAQGGYTFESFRIAWLAQYPIWLLALVGIIVTRGKARRREGVAPKPLRDVAARVRDRHHD